MRSTIIVTALILLCTACQKKDTTTPDPAKVEINITAPTKGQSYNSTDTVYINADVSYIAEMHGYQITVEDTASGTIVYDTTQHTHADHFVIANKWVHPVTQATSYKMAIMATIDHSGNIARKEVYFVINP